MEQARLGPLYLDCVWILLILLNAHTIDSAKVTSITPRTGSLAGGTKLTIWGEGFSTSTTLGNNAEHGNSVFLAGISGNQFPCPVQEDETISTQIRCDTPSHMPAQKYYMNVVVAGVAVTDLCGGNPTSTSCSFTPSTRNTPTISGFMPRSSTAGTLVTINGQIFTDRMAVDIENRADMSSNKLLRVTVGPLNCELLNGTKPYRLSSDQIKCLTQGTSVGFFNASFIVSGAYGMSSTELDLYRVSYKDDIYTYQVYTVITAVSPHKGSTVGGAILRLYIDNIDNRPPYTPPTVFVGDTACTVTGVVVDRYVECEMTADPHETGPQIGNRGAILEQWSITVSDISDILSLTSSHPGYTKTWIDEMSVTIKGAGSQKMMAFYTPSHSGRYGYRLYAGGLAQLFVNKTEVISVHHGTKHSTHFVLEKGTRYLLEVVHHSTGNSDIALGVIFYDTNFTDDQLGVARQESQTLFVRSIKQNEIQAEMKYAHKKLNRNWGKLDLVRYADKKELRFTNFVSKNPEHEVQLVNISTGHPFRIGLFGVYTEPLQILMLIENNETVGDVFNALPVFGENERVVVNQTINPEGISLLFTFESGRGDFPDIEVLSLFSGNSISYNVTEKVKGQPDMETVSLTFAGRVSEPFNVTELTDSKVFDVIGGMFVAKCPDIFSEEAVQFTDYENEVGSHKTDAFCGRATMRNPHFLYKASLNRGIDVTEDGDRYVCFAYKGSLKSYIHLKYTYPNLEPYEIVSSEENFPHSFQRAGKWKHTCFDMFESLYNSLSGDVDTMNVYQIIVARLGTLLVDTFYIGSKDYSNDPDMSLRRLAPVRPNDVLFESYSVTATTPGVYKVTMVPVKCDHNYPLFELTNGKIITGSTLQSSSMAELGLSNGGQGSLLVTRLQSASPPATGHVDISLDNKTKTKLDVNLAANEFKRELETLDGIGSLTVNKKGDCYNFEFAVNFVTRTGDLPEMEVDDTNLHGREASMTAKSNLNGSLTIFPLPGDMLATVHDKPQVRAYVNGVPTACSGDCTVEWTSTVTPTVASVTPISGTSALGTVLTIDGVGFSAATDNNTVVIGGVPCVVSMATDTRINCNVGNGPIGSHKVKVSVKGKGYAADPDRDMTFTYAAGVKSITPNSSSLGGGLTLTLSGYGFKSGAKVTINSQPCEVLTNEPHQITCILPAQNTPGSYAVSVSMGETTLAYNDILYESNQGQVITNINPGYVRVGGGTITITGSGFGSQGKVNIGNQLANVSSWTGNQIVIEIGPIDPGIHEVKVQTDTGFALLRNNTFPRIYIELFIKDVYPWWGSIQGGTELTIKGLGFGTDQDIVDISIGTVHCDILSLGDQQIICMTDNAATVHYVTNQGVDPAFGIYYAFDKPFITIKKGDFVDWSWTTPTFVKNVKHSIIEIENSSNRRAKKGGFSSQASSSNGRFRHQFTETGTYYVWSGYVDVYRIKNYIGTVKVIEATSSTGMVRVEVHGKTALHDVGAAISNPSDTSNCQPLTDGIKNCDDPLPIGDKSDVFYFAFWTCSTPIITHMNPLYGTVQTVITLKGQGFSTKKCNNEVMFGLSTCVVSSSKSSSISCTWEKTGSTELGVLQPVSVRVSNLGNALINIMSIKDRSFGLVPSIESIQPDEGSLAGGATITVSGFGFGSSLMVLIFGYTCSITTVTFSVIECKTPNSNVALTRDVMVIVMFNGVFVPAKCETPTKTCQYTYKNSSTPSILTIEPDSMSAATTFTVSGRGLGNSTTNLDVIIGGVKADILNATNTKLTFTVDAIPVGSNLVTVSRANVGLAQGSLIITGEPRIQSVSPTSGSIHGQQTITISGHGFVQGQTTVTLGSLPCGIASISLTELVITSLAHSPGVVELHVTSNSVSYDAGNYSYGNNATPTVASISPSSGLSGTSLTITGDNFAGGNVTVILGDVECNVTGHSKREIQCIAGDHATGSVSVYVHVANLGASNSDAQFEYQLYMDSIYPIQGGIGGGQRLTVTGTGFTSQAVVKICGHICKMIGTNTTHYNCKTPALSDQECSVTVSLNGLVKTSPGTYKYDSALTPIVEDVSPICGGTGGGYSISITGDGFGTDLSAVRVSIDGAVCEVENVIDTEIQCIVGPHIGPVHTNVEVEIGDNGIATESSPGVSNFEYIDLWSSNFTWGGGPLPGAGEIVVIPAGHTVLLDTDTPVIKVILIQGGTLVFDEKDIELNAEIILITDGGVLQVGTENHPFEHKADIILHGHVRSKNLPIYGTKCIAVRNGTLDLHGKELPIVWTRLADTAPENATNITLIQPVSWNVGDEIVIATTGHRHSQSENEQRTITNVSEDGMTLTLNTPLSAKHVGTGEWFNGSWVEFRAEVGLLTRNVVVRGNTDPQWEEKIDACPAGFNTGQFATQTCFLGRHGEEVGSSQFGAHVILHATVPDSQAAIAKFSYVEFTFVGQAFRLGRYPVHFHLNGDMSYSYIKGCSIHKSFNRAVNIHGSDNVLVDSNVIYDIMGGAIFLEDGIETRNTFQYNLAIFVRASSSLNNDDITPATFWVTNPNNIVQHNVAAGGTHFGYWYRLHSVPEGPSSRKKVCAHHVPLGKFYNNSAHSFGWYGLWVFPVYYPTHGRCSDRRPIPAVFQKFFSWNNNKGAEAVNSWTLQFDDFTLVQNNIAGFQGIYANCKEVPINNGSMIKNSLIVGQTSVVEGQGCTRTGLIFPKGSRFQLQNVTFVNFLDNGCKALSNPAFNITFEAIVMVDVTNPGFITWELEDIIIADKDGTLTNSEEGGHIILTDSGIFPWDCNVLTNFIPGTMLCPFHYRLHLFKFVISDPLWLCGKGLTFVSRYGNKTLQYNYKDESWRGFLVSGEEYELIWENASPITNITFTAYIIGLSVTDSIILNIKLMEYPDQFSLNRRIYKEADKAVTFDNVVNGIWKWIDDELNDRKLIKFSIKGTQVRRESYIDCSVLHKLHLVVRKCVFPGCILPPDPEKTRPMPNPNKHDLPARENSIARGCVYWHTERIWRKLSHGNIIVDLNAEEPFYGLPRLMDTVTIPNNLCVKMNNTDVPKLNILIVEGILEICEFPGWHYELSFNLIIVRGGRLIAGWSDDPFDVTTLSIVMRGNSSAPNYKMDGTTEIRSKTIAVFGGLDLFGNNVIVTWTSLATTASPGSDRIKLREPVPWSVGDEIVIGPTGYDPSETETVRIISIADDKTKLTLNTTLKYRHIGHSETIGGRMFEPSAPVGLLTRTIKVTGEQYAGWEQEQYGPVIHVGLYITDHRYYRGYARLSNVEFIQTGQSEIRPGPCTCTKHARAEQPSVSYKNTAIVDNIKPSLLQNCTFRDSFATAIRVAGLRKLEISHNVIAYTKNTGIQTSSDDTKILHNMITSVSGTGIDTSKADKVQLQDNMIAGAVPYGFKVSPLKCNEHADLYRNNWVQAGKTGFAIFPAQKLVSSSCVLIKGFNIWKQRDYGLYYNNRASLKVKDCIFAENGNGVMTFIIGPNAVKHERENKYVEVSDSLLIGTTTLFDCGTDGATIRGSNAVKAPDGGMVGVVFPSFTSSSNHCPKYSWSNILNYPAIGGQMKLKNVIFAHYKSTACNRAYAVTTNPNNDDGQHPIETRGISLVDVDESYKIAYHNPNIGKISPADCVDMDCDGLKKALFKDLDGTFIGSTGSVIPYSEFEWDGDSRRGLGDYRIPKTMVTQPDGTRIPYDTLMPHKGIVRNNKCTFMSSWNAYKCYDTNYQMLIIESMDSDTETRRISPVALLGNGYIDLINGPQDHGWCSHYMCRKRLSTFMAIVATDVEYLLHFTGTTPRNMRYHLLNSEQDNGIKLTVWYERPNRLDVFVDGNFLISTNIEINSLGYYVTKFGKGNEFIPVIDNTTGTNYFDRDSGLLSIIIKGPAIVDVKTKETIVVSFGLPAMTEDDFYGENLVEVLANFFNVPLNKVRILNIVSASGTSRQRRRRQAEDVSGPENIIRVDVEIGDAPNSTDSFSNNDLKVIASDIINQCQLGDVQRSLNTSGYCESVVGPAAPASDTAHTYIPQRPENLVLYSQPIAGNEGQLFTQQPKLHAHDREGVFVSSLGIEDYPWQITISIKTGTGHPDAVVSGTLPVSSVHGWFNFTDLQISHMGIGYVLVFQVVYPDMASSFAATTAEFTVSGPRVYAHVLSLNNDDDLEPDLPFTVTLDLRNGSSGDIITDISWRSHTWSATARMLGSPQYATLEGKTSVTFDPQSGQGHFTDLQISHHGIYYLQFRIESSPAYYDFVVNKKLIIMNTQFKNKDLNYSKELELKFDSAYNSVLFDVDRENEFEQFILEDLVYQFPEVAFQTSNIARGSIKLQTKIAAANETQLDTVLDTLCDIIYNGSTYSFHGNNLTLAYYMLVDNSMFYGVFCHANAEDEVSPLTVFLLALVVAGSALLVAAVGTIVGWRKCVRMKKSSTGLFASRLRLTSASSLKSSRRTSVVTPVSDNLYQDEDIIIPDLSPPTRKPKSKSPVTMMVKPASTIIVGKSLPKQEEDRYPASARLSKFHGFTSKPASTSVIKNSPTKVDKI